MAPLVRLSPEAQRALEHWARHPDGCAAIAQRARIILACARASSHREVAVRLDVSVQTVSKWRRRFDESGLVALSATQRPSTSAGKDASQEVLMKHLRRFHVEGIRPSTRALADATGLSQSSVSRLLRTHALRPEPSEFAESCRTQLSRDHVREILGLYIGPGGQALAIELGKPCHVESDASKHQHSFPALRPSVTELVRGASGMVRPRGRARRDAVATWVQSLERRLSQDARLQLLVSRGGMLATRWDGSVGSTSRVSATRAPPGTAWVTLVEEWVQVLLARRSPGSGAQELVRSLTQAISEPPPASGAYAWIYGPTLADAGD